MKRILYLLFTAVLISNSAAAGTETSPGQVSTVDSIIAQISTLTGQEKLDAYTFLDHELNNLDDIDIHIHYLNEYIAEARRQGNKEEEIYARLQKLVMFDNYSMSDSLWHYAPEILELLKKEEEWNYYYYLTSLLNTDLVLTGKVDEAFEFTRNCYEYAKKRGFDKGIGVALSNTGRIFHHIENMDEAEKQYREAIAILCKTDEQNVLYDTYSHLAEILSFSERYSEKLAIIKQWESVLAKDYPHPRPDAPTMAPAQWFNLYLEYATAYTQLGDFDQAWHYLELAKTLPLAQIGIGRTQVALCQFYLHEELGEYDEALVMADSVYRMCLALNDYNFTNMLQAKIRIARKKGDFEMAVHVYDTITTLRDSMQKVEITAQLDELRTQYEVDRHIEARRLSQVYVVLFAGISVLALLTLGVWVIYSRRLANKNRALVKRIREQDAQAALPMCFGEVFMRDAPAGERDELLERITMLVEQQQAYTDASLNRTSLAVLVGSNEMYVRRSILQNTGLTVNDYLNRLRLQHARRLLTNPGLTIEAVALDSGFGTRGTFHNVFRKEYGLTPNEFRKYAPVITA